MVDVRALTPHPKNPNRGNADVIAESITENGFYGQIIAQRSTGHVLVGHHRLMAARQLGAQDVPVTWVDVDDTRALKIMLADNRTAEQAHRDGEALAELLAELNTLDTLTGTGYTDSDLDALLADLTAAAPTPAPTEAPEPQVDRAAELQAKWKTERGQLWVIPSVTVPGRSHRLLCGDSTSAADVARLTDGEAAQLLHADPPYGMGKESEGVANDNLYAAKLDAFQMSWWRTFRPHLEENASWYIWGNPTELWRLWYRGGLSDEPDIELKNEIVWSKPSGMGMRSDEMRGFAINTERCLFGMLGLQKTGNNQEHYFQGWEPLRSYLAGEVEKMGWTPADVKRITGVGMFSHWFTRSQWAMIPEAHYRKLQAAAAGAFQKEYAAFQREYATVQKEFEAIQKAFYASRAYFDNTHDTMHEVWDFGRVVGDERWHHATPKPIPLMERIMRSSAPPGGLVLEPFGGSGSTLVAAERTGRLCYGMELEPKYIAVTLERLSGLGLTPQLA